METAIYSQQRREREKTFTGKTRVIQEQFHSHKTLPSQGPRKKWEGVILIEDDKAMIVGNYASFDVIQYRNRPQRAGMSMIHLLAVPKERIINALDLTHENVNIIDHMIRLFQDLWSRPEDRLAIIEHQRITIKTRGEQDDCDPADTELALRHFKELKADAYQLEFEDFNFGLHLAPDASANDLHLHIIAAPSKFRQYSTSQHDKKTKDAIEVRDFIRGSRPRICESQLRA
jgi:hypothetical protein